MKQKCPCGCALQLSQSDLAAEERLARIAGEYVDGAPITSARVETAHQADRDPMFEQVPGICGKCGGRMTMPAYLVAWLIDRKSPWPTCCSGRVTR